MDNIWPSAAAQISLHDVASRLNVKEWLRLRLPLLEWMARDEKELIGVGESTRNEATGTGAPSSTPDATLSSPASNVLRCTEYSVLILAMFARFLLMRQSLRDAWHERLASCWSRRWLCCRFQTVAAIWSDCCYRYGCAFSTYALSSG